MSHLPFTTTGALRHSGPRRVKRTWGGTLCNVLVLLLLSALAGWLLHCVRHAALPMAVRIPGLAVMPWLQGSVWGLLTFVSVVVLWRAALWIKRRDDEAMALWLAAERRDEESLDRWSVAYSEEDAQWDLAGPSPWAESLAERCRGIDSADVGRIVNALLINCCEAEDLLRKSAEPDAQRPAGPVYCGSCGVLAALMPGPDARHSEAMKRVQGIKSGLSGLARMFPLPPAEARSELGGLPRA